MSRGSLRSDYDPGTVTVTSLNWKRHPGSPPPSLSDVISCNNQTGRSNSRLLPPRPLSFPFHLLHCVTSSHSLLHLSSSFAIPPEAQAPPPKQRSKQWKRSVAGLVFFFFLLHDFDLKIRSKHRRANKTYQIQN